ncbi:hypothetical protein [Cognatiluteimonas profundi]|nr:hypothetical protein [Lysobacter profundi]
MTSRSARALYTGTWQASAVAPSSTAFGATPQQQGKPDLGIGSLAH